MKNKLLVGLLLAVAGAQGCASIGMLGLESRAKERAAQSTRWFDMLNHGELTVEDYQTLHKLQGTLKRWYE